MKHIQILTFVIVLFYFVTNVLAQKASSCVTPDNRIGQCIAIRRCPALLSLIQENKQVEQKVLNFLRESQCGIEGKQPKVCCVVDGHLKELVKDNSHLLPDNKVCGISKGNRIVGGQLTALTEYPWMALIEYDTPSGRGFHCGGSLINNRYILTAAHCVNKVPKSWTITSARLGEYDLNSPIDCEGDTPGLEECADKPLDIGVEEIIVHELYDPNTITQHHDIALFRLAKDVQFSDWVKPICLPTTEEIQNHNFAGASLVVSGWGKTETSAQSSLKLKVEVPVKSDSDCVSRYLKGANLKLIDNQLCAGGVKGKDSCTGDSGGPLMGKVSTEDSWYAIGVVSFGPTNCGLQNWPGVYTKVVPYMPWILSNMKP